MGIKLKRSFYARPTLIVARDLLGKYLIRKIGGENLVGKIVETEAYIGPKDKASHAYLGKRTLRNEAEFLVGGHVYIYLVYGMYWQFNISTGSTGQPECVLVRALQPVFDGCKFKTQNAKCKTTSQNLKLRNLANGPGKLCRWMKFDKSFYGEDLAQSKKIWLAASISSRRASPLGRESGEKIARSKIIAAPRIGIDYAGPVWAKKPWRFYIKDNPFVSKML